MDNMLPFLGRITGVSIKPKSAFYIAGVKNARIKPIKFTEQKPHAARGQQTLLDESKQGHNCENAHIDVWA